MLLIFYFSFCSFIFIALTDDGGKCFSYLHQFFLNTIPLIIVMPILYVLLIV